MTNYGCNGMDDYRFLAWVLEHMGEPPRKKRLGDSSKVGDCLCLGRVSLIDHYGMKCKII